MVVPMSNNQGARTRRLVIAIDGPAAAGKTTVARAIANMFGLAYVSTGFIYRALTLKALRAGADTLLEEALVALACSSDIQVRPDGSGDCRIFLDGEDVTAEVNSPEVGAHVSEVARVGRVRAALLDIQQAIAREGGVVMDGRDIGTVVAPDADVKIFLVADFDERARRRLAQARERGYDVREQSVMDEIKHRDRVDSEREAAPLRAAHGAIVVDTTGKTAEETIREVAELVRKAAAEGGPRRGVPGSEGEQVCST